MEGRPLFPAYASGQPSSSSAGAVPPPTTQPPPPPTQRFGSFDPTLVNRNFLLEEKKKKEEEDVILLSSSSSSDDSVVFVGEKRRHKKDKKKKSKKDKKHKKHKKYKHRGNFFFDSKCDCSNDKLHLEPVSRRSPSPPPPPPPPKRSAIRDRLEGSQRKIIFLEDVPGLRPQDAYVIDKKTGNNYRVPYYSFKDILRPKRPRDHLATSAKPQKIRRYFGRKKKPNDAIPCVTAKKYLPNSVEFLEFIPLKPIDNLPAESEQRPSSSADQSLQEIVANFNRRLDQPNAPAVVWIDMLCLQDLLAFNQMTSTRNAFGNDEEQQNNQLTCNRNFCLDKKLMILERALRQHRRSIELNLINVALRGEHFAELKIECSAIDDQWSQLCTFWPNEPRLWFEWIRFTQRTKSIAEFKAGTRTRKVFRRAIQAFRSDEPELKSRRNNEKVLVDLLHYLTQFYRSIDQPEKAIALWQAAFEFNLHRPKTKVADEEFGETFEEMFQFFEQYWDSGWPRVGEFDQPTVLNEGDKFSQQVLSGFAKFYHHLINQTTSTYVKPTANIDTFNMDALLETNEQVLLEVFETSQTEETKALVWCQLERLRQVLYCLPASVGHEIDHPMDSIEDLERIVLSDDDVKPFLFRLETPEMRYYMVLNFLQFLGIDLVTFDLSAALSTSCFELEHCWHELFDAQSLLSATSERRLLFDAGVVGRRTPGDRFGPMMEQFIVAKSENMLADETLAKRLDRANEAFIDNVFKSAIDAFEAGDDQEKKKTLMLIWVQHRLRRLENGQATTAKEVNNFIKGFLRQPAYRNCLELWFVYCRFKMQQNMTEGVQLFAQTVKLMLSAGADQVDRTMLRKFIIGFVRLLLSLDSVLVHYLQHWRAEDKCSLCQLPTASVSMTVANEVCKAQRLATKILAFLLQNQLSKIGNIDWREPGADVQPEEVERAMAECQAKWTMTTPARIEEVHALALLVYLHRGWRAFEETIKFHLTAPPMSMLLLTYPFDGDDDETKKVATITRSHYLLFLQMHIRQLVLAEVLLDGGNFDYVRIGNLRTDFYHMLDRFPTDPLLLTLMVAFEVKTCHSVFRARAHLVAFGASSQTFEKYLRERYLRAELAEAGTAPAWLSSRSLLEHWNIFVTSFYLELRLLDQGVQTDGKFVDHLCSILAQ